MSSRARSKPGHPWTFHLSSWTFFICSKCTHTHTHSLHTLREPSKNWIWLKVTVPFAESVAGCWGSMCIYRRTVSGLIIPWKWANNVSRSSGKFRQTQRETMSVFGWIWTNRSQHTGREPPDMCEDPVRSESVRFPLITSLQKTGFRGTHTVTPLCQHCR